MPTSRTAGWISPVVVVDGVVRAVWSHELKDGRLTVTVEPFGRFAPATAKAVTGAARRYGELFDADVELTGPSPRDASSQLGVPTGRRPASELPMSRL